MNKRVRRIFIQPEKISSGFLCAICRDVFDDPTQLKCGHCFCYLCIATWKTKSRVCPCCRQFSQELDLPKSFSLAQIIDVLLVKCCYEECEWTGMCRGLKRHQRSCKFRRKQELKPIQTCQTIDLEAEQRKSSKEGSIGNETQEVVEGQISIENIFGFSQPNLPNFPFFLPQNMSSQLGSLHLNMLSSDIQSLFSINQIKGSPQNPIIIDEQGELSPKFCDKEQSSLHRKHFTNSNFYKQPIQIINKFDKSQGRNFINSISSETQKPDSLHPSSTGCPYNEVPLLKATQQQLGQKKSDQKQTPQIPLPDHIMTRSKTKFSMQMLISIKRKPIRKPVHQRKNSIVVIDIQSHS